jgi:dihydroorotate dehydrogenase
MYKKIIRPILFLFNPEQVHHFSLGFIKFICKIPFLAKMLKSYYEVKSPLLEKKLFGLTFENPVGLAAGFDKDAKFYNELSNFGFGFIEIGTLTPTPQDGNPKPRLFRLSEDGALINRMGFNNVGVENAIVELKKTRKVIIGGNIGKSKSTFIDESLNDYLFCFEVLFDYVDYFAINVSSPNTPLLRNLQEKEPLLEILHGLQDLNHRKENSKPILLKIAPDLAEDQLLDIIDIVNETKIAGVIATNTTIDRKKLISKKSIEPGGLSGRPLNNFSTNVIRFLSEKSNKSFSIIGVGGINSPDDAIEKLEAGADLVQIYTGFVYEGPSLVKKINKKILKNLTQN